MAQRLTPDQFRRVRHLAKTSCANYDQGNCLLLEENGESCECPQMISLSLLCRYFREAVLPGNTKLAEKLQIAPLGKACAVCGSHFTPASNRAKYCPFCAVEMRRRRTLARVRKFRGQL